MPEDATAAAQFRCALLRTEQTDIPRASPPIRLLGFERAAVGCVCLTLSVLTAYVVAGPGGKTQVPRGLLGHRPLALQVAKLASTDLPLPEPSAVATLSASSLQQARPGYGKCPVLWSGNANCTQVTTPPHPLSGCCAAAPARRRL
jgi:hypothetical protein